MHNLLISLNQDRYAKGNFMPEVDPSQDWILHSGMETTDYTVLKFSRSLINCDNWDNDITVRKYYLYYLLLTDQ